MKTFSQIVVFILIFCVVFGFVALGFIKINGQELYENKLSEYFQRPVKIGSINYVPPFGIQLQKIESPGVLYIKEVLIYFGLPSIYPKMLVLSSLEIVEPHFFIRKDGPSHWNWLKKSSEQKHSSENDTMKNSPFAMNDMGVQNWDILVHQLVIMNGELQITDFSLSKKDVMNISNINLSAKRIMLPLKSEDLIYQMSAHVLGDNISLSGSHFESYGSINLLKKDMDADLNIIENNGKVGLKAKLKSIDNNMLINGQLLTRTKNGVDDTDSEKSLLDVVLNTMEAIDIDVGLNFAFETKMDNFSINTVEITGSIVQQEK